MNFEKLIDNIIDTCKSIGINPTDYSNTIAKNCSTIELAGVNCQEVYGGTINDIIYIDRIFTKDTGLIELIVNGISYKLEHNYKTGETDCTRAKLFLNGMYYCLDEYERKKVTEQTFNRALHKFKIRNN